MLTHGQTRESYRIGGERIVEARGIKGITKDLKESTNVCPKGLTESETTTN